MIHQTRSDLRQLNRAGKFKTQMIKFSKRNLFRVLDFGHWDLFRNPYFVLRIYHFFHDVLMAWARVRTSTLFAPPLRNTFEHSLTVAPVV